LIRMIILSIAACLSTVGGVYGAVVWKKSASEIANKPAEPKVQVLKTHMVSVPILAEGQVLGYVVTRMEFTADVDQLKTSTVQPEAFVADEAFKIIYDTTPSDIKTGRKQALRDLTSSIVSGVNKRLGRDVVKDVFIDSWAYLSKQDMMSSHDHAR
jgi:flagellar basal body-associated protein FliL